METQINIMDVMAHLGMHFTKMKTRTLVFAVLGILLFSGIVIASVVSERASSDIPELTSAEKSSLRDNGFSLTYKEVGSRDVGDGKTLVYLEFDNGKKATYVFEKEKGNKVEMETALLQRLAVEDSSIQEYEEAVNLNK